MRRRGQDSWVFFRRQYGYLMRDRLRLGTVRLGLSQTKSPQNVFLCEGDGSWNEFG